MFNAQALIQSLRARVPEGSTLIEFLRTEYTSEVEFIEKDYLDESRDETYELFAEHFSNDSGILFTAEFKFVLGQIDIMAKITAAEGELLYSAEYFRGSVTSETFF